ncbi:MAG: ABC transporter substrate-binding protein [Alphaproteobacteria bacterium]
MTIRYGFLGALAAAGIALATAPAIAQSTLRISASSADIATMDPHRATATGDKVLAAQMFNGLVRFPPGSADPKTIEPDLAERWERSPDGLTWTFHLRQGVKFHGDWGTVDAEDVVYSLQRAGDPKRSSFAANYAPIESVTAVDPRTVRIRLKHPIPSLLALVADYHGGNVVSRKAAEAKKEKFASEPVGTGPFAFAEHVTQQHVRLAAHPGYFRGKPKIDSLLFRFIPSDSSRELAFASGELDLIYGKREQRWVATARRRAGTVVDIFQPAEFRTLHINRSIAPLDDVRVRRAIAHAVNVGEIVRFVGADVATAGCSVVPTGYLGEDCAAGGYAFDLGKAKALLAEAGHGGGLTLKVVVSNISAQLPVMEVIQAQLAKVGIKLDMSVVDHSTYHAQIRKNASALVFYGAARFPIADSYLTEFYHSNATVGRPTAITNFSHCAVADAEILAARSEPDDAKQLALWATAQRKIHDDVCGVPLFGLMQVWARSANLDLGYDLKGSLNLGPPITEQSTIKAR